MTGPATRPGSTWRLGFLLLLSCSCLSLAGTRVDEVSIFCHFQVYALLAWAGASATFLLSRRVRQAFDRPRLAFAAALACLLVHGLLVAALWLPGPAWAEPAPARAAGAAGAAGAVLDVVFFNMRHDESALAQVEEQLCADPPDVIVLVETNRRTRPSTLDGYEHVLRSVPSEMGVWSRVPMAAKRAHAVLRDRDLLEVRLEREGRAMTLLAAHWRVPARWSHFLAASATAGLAAGQEDLLLIGDLNSTPWSPQLRELRAEAGLRRVARGVQTTWRRDPWRLLTLPIDHALVKGAVRPIAFERLGWTASDHRPLRVQVAF